MKSLLKSSKNRERYIQIMGTKNLVISTLVVFAMVITMSVVFATVQDEVEPATIAEAEEPNKVQPLALDCPYVFACVKDVQPGDTVIDAPDGIVLRGGEIIVQRGNDPVIIQNAANADKYMTGDRVVASVFMTPSGDNQELFQMEYSTPGHSDAPVWVARRIYSSDGSYKSTISFPISAPGFDIKDGFFRNDSYNVGKKVNSFGRNGTKVAFSTDITYADALQVYVYVRRVEIASGAGYAPGGTVKGFKLLSQDRPTTSESALVNGPTLPGERVSTGNAWKGDLLIVNSQMVESGDGSGVGSTMIGVDDISDNTFITDDAGLSRVREGNTNFWSVETQVMMQLSGYMGNEPLRVPSTDNPVDTDITVNEANMDVVMKWLGLHQFEIDGDIYTSLVATREYDAVWAFSFAVRDHKLMLIKATKFSAEEMENKRIVVSNANAFEYVTALGVVYGKDGGFVNKELVDYGNGDYVYDYQNEGKRYIIRVPHDMLDSYIRNSEREVNGEEILFVYEINDDGEYVLVDMLHKGLGEGDFVQARVVSSSSLPADYGKNTKYTFFKKMTNVGESVYYQPFGDMNAVRVSEDVVSNLTSGEDSSYLLFDSLAEAEVFGELANGWAYKDGDNIVYIIDTGEGELRRVVLDSGTLDNFKQRSFVDFGSEKKIGEMANFLVGVGSGNDKVYHYSESGFIKGKVTFFGDEAEYAIIDATVSNASGTINITYLGRDNSRITIPLRDAGFITFPDYVIDELLTRAAAFNPNIYKKVEELLKSDTVITVRNFDDSAVSYRSETGDPANPENPASISYQNRDFPGDGDQFKDGDFLVDVVSLRDGGDVFLVKRGDRYIYLPMTENNSDRLGYEINTVSEFQINDTIVETPKWISLPPESVVVRRASGDIGTKLVAVRNVEHPERLKAGMRIVEEPYYIDKNKARSGSIEISGQYRTWVMRTVSSLTSTLKGGKPNTSDAITSVDFVYPIDIDFESGFIRYNGAAVDQTVNLLDRDTTTTVDGKQVSVRTWIKTAEVVGRSLTGEISEGGNSVIDFQIATKNWDLGVSNGYDSTPLVRPSGRQGSREGDLLVAGRQDEPLHFRIPGIDGLVSYSDGGNAPVVASVTNDCSLEAYIHVAAGATVSPQADLETQEANLVKAVKQMYKVSYPNVLSFSDTQIDLIDKYLSSHSFSIEGVEGTFTSLIIGETATFAIGFERNGNKLAITNLRIVTSDMLKRSFLPRDEASLSYLTRLGITSAQFPVSDSSKIGDVVVDVDRFMGSNEKKVLVERTNDDGTKSRFVLDGIEHPEMYKKGDVFVANPEIDGALNIDGTPFVSRTIERVFTVYSVTRNYKLIMQPDAYFDTPRKQQPDYRDTDGGFSGDLEAMVPKGEHTATHWVHFSVDEDGIEEIVRVADIRPIALLSGQRSSVSPFLTDPGQYFVDNFRSVQNDSGGYDIVCSAYTGFGNAYNLMDASSLGLDGLASDINISQKVAIDMARRQSFFQMLLGMPAEQLLRNEATLSIFGDAEQKVYLTPFKDIATDTYTLFSFDAVRQTAEGVSFVSGERTKGISPGDIKKRTFMTTHEDLYRYMATEGFTILQKLEGIPTPHGGQAFRAASPVLGEGGHITLEGRADGSFEVLTDDFNALPQSIIIPQDRLSEYNPDNDHFVPARDTVNTFKRVNDGFEFSGVARAGDVISAQIFNGRDVLLVENSLGRLATTDNSGNLFEVSENSDRFIVSRDYAPHFSGNARLKIAYYDENGLVHLPVSIQNFDATTSAEIIGTLDNIRRRYNADIPSSVDATELMRGRKPLKEIRIGEAVNELYPSDNLSGGIALVDQFVKGRMIFKDAVASPSVPVLDLATRDDGSIVITYIDNDYIIKQRVIEGLLDAKSEPLPLPQDIAAILIPQYVMDDFETSTATQRARFNDEESKRFWRAEALFNRVENYDSENVDLSANGDPANPANPVSPNYVPPTNGGGNCAFAAFRLPFGGSESTVRAELRGDAIVTPSPFECVADGYEHDTTVYHGDIVIEVREDAIVVERIVGGERKIVIVDGDIGITKNYRVYDRIVTVSDDLPGYLYYRERNLPSVFRVGNDGRAYIMQPGIEGFTFTVDNESDGNQSGTTRERHLWQPFQDVNGRYAGTKGADVFVYQRSVECDRITMTIAESSVSQEGIMDVQQNSNGFGFDLVLRKYNTSDDGLNYYLGTGELREFNYTQNLYGLLSFGGPTDRAAITISDATREMIIEASCEILGESGYFLPPFMKPDGSPDFGSWQALKILDEAGQPVVGDFMRGVTYTQAEMKDQVFMIGSLASVNYIKETGAVVLTKSVGYNPLFLGQNSILTQSLTLADGTNISIRLFVRPDGGYDFYDYGDKEPEFLYVQSERAKEIFLTKGLPSSRIAYRKAGDAKFYVDFEFEGGQQRTAVFSSYDALRSSMQQGFTTDYISGKKVIVVDAQDGGKLILKSDGNGRYTDASNTLIVVDSVTAQRQLLEAGALPNKVALMNPDDGSVTAKFFVDNDPVVIKATSVDDFVSRARGVFYDNSLISVYTVLTDAQSGTRMLLKVVADQKYERISINKPIILRGKDEYTEATNFGAPSDLMAYCSGVACSMLLMQLEQEGGIFNTVQFSGREDMIGRLNGVETSNYGTLLCVKDANGATEFFQRKSESIYSRVGNADGTVIVELKSARARLIKLGASPFMAAYKLNDGTDGVGMDLSTDQGAIYVRFPTEGSFQSHFARVNVLPIRDVNGLTVHVFDTDNGKEILTSDANYVLRLATVTDPVIVGSVEAFESLIDGGAPISKLSGSSGDGTVVMEPFERSHFQVFFENIEDMHRRLAGIQDGASNTLHVFYDTDNSPLLSLRNRDGKYTRITTANPVTVENSSIRDQLIDLGLPQDITQLLVRVSASACPVGGGAALRTMSREGFEASTAAPSVDSFQAPMAFGEGASDGCNAGSDDEREGYELRELDDGTRIWIRDEDFDEYDTRLDFFDTEVIITDDTKVNVYKEISPNEYEFVGAEKPLGFIDYGDGHPKSPIFSVEIKGDGTLVFNADSNGRPLHVIDSHGKVMQVTGDFTEFDTETMTELVDTHGGRLVLSVEKVAELEEEGALPDEVFHRLSTLLPSGRITEEISDGVYLMYDQDNVPDASVRARLKDGYHGLLSVEADEHYPIIEKVTGSSSGNTYIRYVGMSNDVPDGVLKLRGPDGSEYSCRIIDVKVSTYAFAPSASIDVEVPAEDGSVSRVVTMDYHSITEGATLLIQGKYFTIESVDIKEEIGGRVQREMASQAKSTMSSTLQSHEARLADNGTAGTVLRGLADATAAIGAMANREKVDETKSGEMEPFDEIKAPKPKLSLTERATQWAQNSQGLKAVGKGVGYAMLALSIYSAYQTIYAVAKNASDPMGLQLNNISEELNALGKQISGDFNSIYMSYSSSVLAKRLGHFIGIRNCFSDNESRSMRSLNQALNSARALGGFGDYYAKKTGKPAPSGLSDVPSDDLLEYENLFEEYLMSDSVDNSSFLAIASQIFSLSGSYDESHNIEQQIDLEYYNDFMDYAGAVTDLSLSNNFSGTIFEINRAFEDIEGSTPLWEFEKNDYLKHFNKLVIHEIEESADALIFSMDAAIARIGKDRANLESKVLECGGNCVPDGYTKSSLQLAFQSYEYNIKTINGYISKVEGALHSSEKAYSDAMSSLEKLGAGSGEVRATTVYSRSIDKNIDGQNLQGVIALPGRDNLGKTADAITSDDLKKLEEEFAGNNEAGKTDSEIKAIRTKNIFNYFVYIGLIVKTPIVDACKGYQAKDHDECKNDSSYKFKWVNEKSTASDNTSLTLKSDRTSYSVNEFGQYQLDIPKSKFADGTENSVSSVVINGSGKYVAMPACGSEFYSPETWRSRNDIFSYRYVIDVSKVDISKTQEFCFAPTSAGITTIKVTVRYADGTVSETGLNISVGLSDDNILGHVGNQFTTVGASTENSSETGYLVNSKKVTTLRPYYLAGDSDIITASTNSVVPPTATKLETVSSFTVTADKPGSMLFKTAIKATGGKIEVFVNGAYKTSQNFSYWDDYWKNSSLKISNLLQGDVIEIRITTGEYDTYMSLANQDLEYYFDKNTDFDDVNQTLSIAIGAVLNFSTTYTINTPQTFNKKTNTVAFPSNVYVMSKHGQVCAGSSTFNCSNDGAKLLITNDDLKFTYGSYGLYSGPDELTIVAYYPDGHALELTREFLLTSNVVETNIESKDDTSLTCVDLPTGEFEKSQAFLDCSIMNNAARVETHTAAYNVVIMNKSTKELYQNMPLTIPAGEKGKFTWDLSNLFEITRSVTSYSCRPGAEYVETEHEHFCQLKDGLGGVVKVPIITTKTYFGNVDLRNVVISVRNMNNQEVAKWTDTRISQ